MLSEENRTRQCGTGRPRRRPDLMWRTASAAASMCHKDDRQRQITLGAIHMQVTTIGINLAPCLISMFRAHKITVTELPRLVDQHSPNSAVSPFNARWSGAVWSAPIERNPHGYAVASRTARLRGADVGFWHGVPWRSGEVHVRERCKIPRREVFAVTGALRRR
jgi:hypothetical protein